MLKKKQVKKRLLLNVLKQCLKNYIRKKTLVRRHHLLCFEKTTSKYIIRNKKNSRILSKLGIFPIKNVYSEFSYRCGLGILCMHPQKLYTFTLPRADKI